MYKQKIYIYRYIRAYIERELSLSLYLYIYMYISWTASNQSRISVNTYYHTVHDGLVTKPNINLLPGDNKKKEKKTLLYHPGVVSSYIIVTTHLRLSENLPAIHHHLGKMPLMRSRWMVRLLFVHTQGRRRRGKTGGWWWCNVHLFIITALRLRFLQSHHI